MPAKIVRVNYDTLAKISKEFRRQAAELERTNRRIRGQKDSLQSGGWLGKGAQTFYREMDDEILPSLDRLSRSLHSADRVTRQITKLIQQAEGDLAAIFRSEGTGGGSPAEQTSSGAQSSGGRTTAGGASPLDRALGLVDDLRNAYNDSSLYQNMSGIFSALDNARDLSEYLDDVPKNVQKVLDNPYLKRGGKVLGPFGTGLDVVNFTRDPGVQSGADLGIGLLGMTGNPYLMSFSAGYDFGSAFIAPYTTEPLSDALLEWDPLGLVE